MLRQLKLRDRLVAMVAVQTLVIAVLAAGALLFLDAETGVRAYGLFALGGLIGGGAVAVVVGRSILSSIGELTTATARLAQAQDAMAADGSAPPAFSPIPVNGADPELGELAAAINASQTATAQLAESQQGAVKAGLSNIVVNLARRSQSLLDRQVEYIDSLETTEEDPDRLHELFKVDHLATRMRRNAESLLVLAGAEPPRRRGGPVDIADVLRVAMGEVEKYQNIELVAVDNGLVSSDTAVDLAHLVAELMENATQFSPPDAPVQVRGWFADGYKFRISIADNGIGMSDDQLAVANETLSNPPELGLSMGRSLGFAVIGRLARRLRADVRLRKSTSSGLTAVVDLPADHLIDTAEDLDVEPGDERDTEPEVAAEGDEPRGVPRPWAEADPVEDTADRQLFEERRKPSIRTGDRERLTAHENSAALSKLLGIDPGVPAMESHGWTPPEVTADAPLEASRNRRSTDEPDRAERRWIPHDDAEPETPPAGDEPANLDEAIPRGSAFESGVASLLGPEESTERWTPPAAGDGAAGELAQRTRGATRSPIGETRPVAASSRKPEEVRSMLSKYREGLRGGRKRAAEPGAGDYDRRDDA